MNSIPHKLQQVLEIAVTAQGNWERFKTANLIDKRSTASSLKLVENWQENFANLIPIDKSIIRSNPSLFLTNVDDIIYRGMTSGTTGESFTYFAGNDWNKKRIEVRHRSLQWWEITAQVPIINVASRLFPIREQDISLVGSIDQEFLHTLLSLLAEKLCVIRGYPSRLCEVATYLYPKKIPTVKAIICTGECLFDYQKKLLEDVFNAPIINEYGCQESGISGFTCPEEGRLHLDSDRCFYEIINGKLVTTDLYNYIMPMVRYECGDILELYNTPCPCGRSGLTGKILGREENQIETLKGKQWSGNIMMPSFEGILNYRVIRQSDHQVEIWVQSTDGLSPDIKPLENWIQSQFGSVSTKIYFDNGKSPIIPKKNQSISFKEWQENITHKSWSLWLQNPIIPDGYVQVAARLFKALINPRIIVNSNIPYHIQDCLNELIDLPPCSDPDMEIITARILLFAGSCLASRIEVNSIYHQGINRLRNALPSDPKYHSARLDMLIPSLYLNPDLTKTIWTEHQEFNLTSLDTFNIHHLLIAFETACQKRKEFYDLSSLGKLTTILSLLIGDLTYFSSTFCPELLAHWCHIFQPNFPNFSFDSVSKSPFITAWLKWRYSLINSQKNSEILWLNLEKVAETAEEKARIMVEKSYELMIKKQSINPQEWLSIINNNSNLLTQGLDRKEVDLTPWIPILRYLVNPLFKQGERQLAYQCLVLSTSSSSQYSSFERLARFNSKQLVIS